MGEANLRVDEINNIKDRAAVDAQQRKMMAYMMKPQAVYVNGFYLAMSGAMARIVMLETIVPESPSEVRGAFVLHPQDLEQLVRGGTQLLEAMRRERPPEAEAATEGGPAQDKVN